MTARAWLADPPADADVVTSAPGRANLIGEYTDICEGWVLPVALDLRTALLGRRIADRLVVRSLDRPEDGVVEVDLRSGAGPDRGWGRYATAVVGVLRDAGLRLHGFDGMLVSDVPIGAGLSSSAALEVAVALAVLAEPVEQLRLALLCQRAENEGVGVQSGIMDQLASAAAEDGSALLIDCRELSMQHVALPVGLAVLVIDSGVSRDLTSSAYNDRRAECAAAAKALGVDVLRDASSELLAARGAELPDVLLRRARHVVTENERVLATAQALRDNDVDVLRPLLEASHRSLAEDFEVSTPELDLLVSIAGETAGVRASRMTGAGFGGCTVSLVDAAAAEACRDEICARYEARSGRHPRAWVSGAAGGARVQ